MIVNRGTAVFVTCPDKTRSSASLAKLLRFDNSQNVEMTAANSFPKKADLSGAL